MNISSDCKWVRHKKNIEDGPSLDKTKIPLPKSEKKMKKQFSPVSSIPDNFINSGRSETKIFIQLLISIHSSYAHTLFVCADTQAQTKI